ncbi:4-alpha-glucanotransferase [Dehalogenimonas etheniformans]|uniref:4-alpha-glucanotransferase n=1 Tax=Dehalogenimonas etheniformans TaxID=1536648 RepID=A0A2P5P9N1_9CHLR|nr:4-alpha-glucanotransferase [Dehalogenimonas etheniformans]PPD59009.1 4-alpha-glucanotransferase [Dehalogenimonas etheniformans]QNT76223.1 4-alpha-glucanotransferase [Dehalogenimonas etheniformans]
MRKGRQDNKLKELARACGVQVSYRDMGGRVRNASTQTLLAVVGALGIPVAGETNFASALNELKSKRSRRIIEPVILAWEGRLPILRIRLHHPLPATVGLVLELENAQIRRFSWTELSRFEMQTKDKTENTFHFLSLPLRQRLPFGYHRLSLILPEETVSATIISAPRKAPEYSGKRRKWGLFCPVYALHSKNNWGAGDYSDFNKLARWSTLLGSGFTATLPLLPALYREHFNLSPYSPASRLFWNEFFIDVAAVPELVHCPEAQAFVDTDEFRNALAEQRGETMVDYARLADLKRSVLEILAECFFKRPQSESRRELFTQFLQECPEIEEYARFRAVSEKHKSSWWEWPDEIRDGSLDAWAIDPTIEHYHLYAQFIAWEQIRDVADTSKQNGQTLYLDLPLGCNPEGYDVWKNQGIFAFGSSVGAPPDAAFPGGQDWGFPPPHPERQRETGYRYFIDVVRHHLRVAGMLRLDHVMSLHRLYWIPEGTGAKEGVYVRYAAEEMYAILCLEALRANAVIVGEDLGLVPSIVRRSMQRHNLKRSYIAQYEMLAGNDNCLDTIPVSAVAAVNTHDMHPFASFWQMTDISERRECGVLSDERAKIEAGRRVVGKEILSHCLYQRNLIPSQNHSPMEVYKAICRVMASSDVEFMLINVDDLGGSTKAQNIPGTCAQHPNWRRRTPLSLERLEVDPQVESFLREIDALRKRSNVPDMMSRRLGTLKAGIDIG